MPARNAAEIRALKRLGHIVAKRRIEANKTQDDMSDACGISTRYWGALERGAGNPSFLTLRAIAAALSIDVEDLLKEAR